MTRRNLENDKKTSAGSAATTMTPATTPSKGWSQTPEIPITFAMRPALTSQQSSSLPSTPYQRPRDVSRRRKSPSPTRTGPNSSPRSSLSDSNQSLPSLRKAHGGCKYETGMAQAKRRVPYSLGSERLNAEPIVKSKLSEREDEKLSGDMRELYDRLLPSPESESRRKQLIEKLERLLNTRWPGHDIKVNVFGSTGNKLGTTDSDVDICITTDLKELEHVCSLADLLAKNGMQRVVCVSSAKVPIVKAWDPQLELACDMNVNNPIALENTDMIRTYVSIDDRVQPLAMIIKHWARRRMLNDPALGSTLSSYTWICMIINFLQTRTPPILPSLQQQPNLKRKILNGVDVTFDKDITLYRGYGARNKDSIGQLLFQFFRYYGHEVDYESQVLSVRMGRSISKLEKGWHLLQNNRLCVEEPFNTLRNLGNTADDTSMRGIHLELRRAFRTVGQASLERCCEHYEYPAEESKTLQNFQIPESKPVIASKPPQPGRGAHTNGRGGRHASRGRGANINNRRPSNPNSNARVHPSLRQFPYQMSPQDLQMHAQQQQFLLHDQLYQQFQYLQAQEQELRQQLQQQALLQGRISATLPYPHITFPTYATAESVQDGSERIRADTINHPPLTAPVRQQRFAYASPYLTYAMPRPQLPTTNPSSPHLRYAIPDHQRASRQAVVTDSFPNSALRAQSQPPRPMPSPMSFQPTMTDSVEETEPATGVHAQQRRPSAAIMNGFPAPDQSVHRASMQTNTRLGGRQSSSEYVGYYVGHSPPTQARSRSSFASPMPSYSGLNIYNGGLSPGLFTRLPVYQPSAVSPPIESGYTPSDDTVTEASERPASPIECASRTSPTKLQRRRSGPLVVDGSLVAGTKTADISGDDQDPSTGTTFSASTSEDLAFDTPTSSEAQSQGLPEVIDSDLPLLSVHSHPDLEQAAVSLPISNGYSGSSLANGNFADPFNAPSKSGGQPAQNHAMEHLVQGSSADSRSPRKENSPVTSGGKSPVQGSVKGAGQSDGRKPVLPAMENFPTSTAGSVTSLNSNGAVSPAKEALTNVLQSSGWQTAKKRKGHKRGARSETDATRANGLAGDFLPKDKTLRKGG